MRNFIQSITCCVHEVRVALGTSLTAFGGSKRETLDLSVVTVISLTNVHINPTRA